MAILKYMQSFGVYVDFLKNKYNSRNISLLAKRQQL